MANICPGDADQDVNRFDTTMDQSYDQGQQQGEQQGF